MLVQMLTDLAKRAPEIREKLVTMISEALDGIIELAPKIGETAVTILQSFIDAIVAGQQKVWDAAFTLIQGFLDTLLVRIPELTATFVDIIVAFVTAIGNGRLEIIAAIVALIVAFIEELNNHQEEIVTAAGDLIVDFIEGVSAQSERILTAGEDAIVTFLNGMGQRTERVTTAAGEAILSMLGALDQAIVTYSPQISAMGGQIAFHLLQGLVIGLIPEPLRQPISNIVNDMVEYFKSLLGIKSPSTVFEGFGNDIVTGLANGIAKMPGAIRDKISETFKAAKELGTSVVNGVIDGLKTWAGDKMNGFSDAVRSAVIAAVNTILPIKIQPFTIGGKYGVPKYSFGGKVLIDKIASNAFGTDFFGGGLSVVGERGPELVSMNRGSAVITNKNLVAFMASVDKLAKVLSRSNNRISNSSTGVINLNVGVDYDGAHTPAVLLNDKMAKRLEMLSAIDVSPAQAAFDLFTRAMLDAATDTPKEISPKEIKFEQHNHSPEPISAVDSYRNGKSLIAIAERRLAKIPED